jgi:hypothetical protein
MQLVTNGSVYGDSLPWVWCPVGIELSSTPLSLNAALITVTLSNGLSAATTVSFRCHARLNCWVNDYGGISDVFDLGGSRGYTAIPRKLTEGENNWAVSYLLRNWPLVDNVDSYWFGRYTELWNSIESNGSDVYHAAEDGVDVAFSWQNRVIEASSSINLSILAITGVPDDCPPELNMSATTISDLVSSAGSISLLGRVDHGNLNQVLQVFVVVESDPIYVAWDLPPGAPFNATVSTSTLGLVDGQYTLSVYAEDDRGAVGALAL